jgi:peroxiredoxin
MSRIAKTFALSFLFAGVVLGAVPKVGDRAPDFSLPATNGTRVSLKDYLGKSKVVLLFYRGNW